MNDGKQEVEQKSWHSIWTLGTLSSLDFRKDVLDEDEDTGPSKPLPEAGAANHYFSRPVALDFMLGYHFNLPGRSVGRKLSNKMPIYPQAL